MEYRIYEIGQEFADACDTTMKDVGAHGSVQGVPYNVLRERLLEQGAVLDVFLVGKLDFCLLRVRKQLFVLSRCTPDLTQAGVHSSIKINTRHLSGTQ